MIGWLIDRFLLYLVIDWFWLARLIWSWFELIWFFLLDRIIDWWFDGLVDGGDVDVDVDVVDDDDDADVER